MISNRGYRALARLVQQFLDRVERIFRGGGGEERRYTYSVYVHASNCWWIFHRVVSPSHVCLTGRRTTGRLLTTVSPITYSLPAQLPRRTRSKSKSRIVFHDVFSLRETWSRVLCPTNKSVAIELIIRSCDTACVHLVSRDCVSRLTVSDTRTIRIAWWLCPVFLVPWFAMEAELFFSFFFRNFLEIVGR